MTLGHRFLPFVGPLDGATEATGTLSFFPHSRSILDQGFLNTEYLSILRELPPDGQHRERFECMPFFVIVIFAASDHWSGSYISQTRYTANGLAEGGLLASGQPLLSDRTLTHLTRSLLFRRWAPLIVRNSRFYSNSLDNLH